MTEDGARKAEAMLSNIRDQVRNQSTHGWSADYDKQGRVVLTPNVCGETVVLNIWAAVASANKAVKR